MEKAKAPHEWHISIDTGGTFTDCLAVNLRTGVTRTSKVLSTSAVRGVVQDIDQDGRLVIRQNWNSAGDFAAGLSFRASDEGEVFQAEVLDFNAQSSTMTLAKNFSRIVPKKLVGRPFELQSPEPSPLLAARLAIGRPIGASLDDIALRLATTKVTNSLLERTFARAALITNRGYGDLLRIGTQQRPHLFELDIHKSPPVIDDVFEIDARLCANGSVEQDVDSEQLAHIAAELQERQISTVAIGKSVV